MSSTTQPPAIPTEATGALVADALQKAYDEVEAFMWELERLDQHGQNEYEVEGITFEAIATAFVVAEDVKRQATVLLEHARRIQQAAWGCDVTRLETRLRRTRNDG